MSAFAYAKRNGADIIEFDVRWTKDQRKYVLHDDRLERTTNGTGRLENHTARYIRSLKVDGGGRVPSFTEITAYAKNQKLIINPEVKPVAGKPFTKAQAKSYVGIVHRHSMEKKTVVSSTSAAILNMIKKYDTKKAMRYSLIQTPAIPCTRFLRLRRWARSTCRPGGKSTAKYVRDLHDHGVQVWAWPIRTDADRDAALALDVDVLVVDDPARRLGDVMITICREPSSGRRASYLARTYVPGNGSTGQGDCEAGDQSPDIGDLWRCRPAAHDAIVEGAHRTGARPQGARHVSPIDNWHRHRCGDDRRDCPRSDCGGRRR